VRIVALLHCEAHTDKKKKKGEMKAVMIAGTHRILEMMFLTIIETSFAV